MQLEGAATLDRVEPGAGPMPKAAAVPVEPTRVLVTGAGRSPGIALIRALSADPTVEVVAADADPYGAGLYLVDDEHRWLLPSGGEEEFVDEALRLCRTERIDVVMPTVDSELRPLAAHRSEFAGAGIRLAVTTQDALVHCLDRMALTQTCARQVRTPRTELLSRSLDPGSWDYPVIVKPRWGSGPRHVSIVWSDVELMHRRPDHAMLVQEYLPGEEYAVDVLVDIDNHVVAVVPRVRLREDGVHCVAGHTLHDPDVDELARGVVDAIGLTLVANIRCRRDAEGTPALLDVSPRFSGSLALTVHSGVNMPRLCLDAVLGKPLPYGVPFRDTTMVRYLDERYFDGSEVQVARTRVAA